MHPTDWNAEAYLRRTLDSGPYPGRSLHTDATWATVLPHGVQAAEHGWKLHISSRAANFPALLRRLVPVLLAEGCPFKVARSTAVLHRINHGRESPAGVGKAVTVYPDPSRVRELGLELADRTYGHEGPRVLSDRRVRQDAPVYYRYGPFAARWYAGERGALALRVPGPDGAFFDAVATLDYREPSWVTDPFAPRPASYGGLGGHPAANGSDGAGTPDGAEVLGGRYRVTRGIYRAAHGSVYRAVDTAEGDLPVVVKQARAHVGEGPDGSDARTRLRNERRILQAATGVPGVPRFLDHFAHGADEFLVTTDAGETNLLLRVRLHGSLMPPAHTSGGTPPPELLRLAAELAGTLDGLHARGIVMRDVTPRNIVLGQESAVVIDFGLAALDGLHLPGGTPGFAPARQLAGEPPLPEDDCYALGMVLGYAATGMLPLSAAREPGLPAARLLQSLSTLYGPEARDFTGLIAALLSGAPIPGSPLSAEPSAALHALSALASGTWPPVRGPGRGPGERAGAGRAGAGRAPGARTAAGRTAGTGAAAGRVPEPRTPYDGKPGAEGRAAAGRVPEARTAAARTAGAGGVPGSRGPEVDPVRLAAHVRATVLDALGPYQLDAPETSVSAVDAGVYTGSAGIGLELLHHQRCEGVPEALGRLAEHAVAAARRVDLAPGLFVGATGMRYFLGRARAAGLTAYGPEDIGQRGEPDPSDDIISGAAGVGLGHLFLADTGVAGEPGGHLEAARAQAAALLARDEPRTVVTADSGLPEAAGVDPTYGYAHGLAGVVDFLLALAARDPGTPAEAGAHRRAVRLRDRTAGLVAASALASAVPVTASWCQGLAGASRALLHAGTYFDDPSFTAAGRAAALACADWLPRMENLSQCCGAAGAGAALLEFARATGDERCWTGAHAAARHLLVRSFGPDEEPRFIDLEGQDAPLSWGMGAAGLLTFLRELADPGAPGLFPPVLPEGLVRPDR